MAELFIDTTNSLLVIPSAYFMWSSRFTLGLIRGVRSSSKHNRSGSWPFVDAIHVTDTATLKMKTEVKNKLKSSSAIKGDFTVKNENLN